MYSCQVRNSTSSSKSSHQIQRFRILSGTWRSGIKYFYFFFFFMWFLTLSIIFSSTLCSSTAVLGVYLNIPVLNFSLARSTTVVQLYSWPCSWLYCAFAPKLGFVFKSISNPPFSQRWEHFEKLARVVPFLLEFRVVPHEPIFQKCSHLRQKWGALIFSGFVWWIVSAESSIQI